MYKYLNFISSPTDIKKLNTDELKVLASEMRDAILNRLALKGGHFGPNLGIVECTIALHYVFNSPVDKFVFDVSHQSYPHKLLTGRVSNFLCEDKLDDICGFTNPSESEHDIFNVGHTSTSISLACGLAKGRDLKNSNENIIAIIGDGSLSGGQALEGLNFASELNSNLIIVVNDNNMSIAENHGGLYASLKELRATNGTAQGNIFKAFGLDYKYVADGNDICALIDAFSSIKDTPRPVVLHINTIKGKGYERAECEKEKYHFYGPFDKKTGELTYKSQGESYISIARDYAVNRAKNDKLFTVVCAGAPSAIGFDKEIRDSLGAKYVDVGIAEEHAVGFASALARAGARPIFATYSSFIQRCYDQISQDLCLNSSPATLLISNASIYGMRDQTHLGFFDIPLLSSIPNLVYLAPASKEELVSMLEWSTSQDKCPVAIKNPAGPVFSADYDVRTDYSDNRYQITKKGQDVAILALGSFYKIGLELHSELGKRGINATLVNPCFANIVDYATLDALRENHSTFVTLEDGVLNGGFGHGVASYLARYAVRTYTYGLKREFVDRYDIPTLLRDNHLTPEQIIADIL